MKDVGWLSTVAVLLLAAYGFVEYILVRRAISRDGGQISIGRRTAVSSAVVGIALVLTYVGKAVDEGPVNLRLAILLVISWVLVTLALVMAYKVVQHSPASRIWK